jgi:hypothetical protein
MIHANPRLILSASPATGARIESRADLTRFYDNSAGTHPSSRVVAAPGTKRAPCGAPVPDEQLENG